MVEKLVACHNEHSIGKWFGACNQLKNDLDECFFMEKEIKRRANLAKARDFDTNFEEYLQKKEAAEAAAAAAAASAASATSKSIPK